MAHIQVEKQQNNKLLLFLIENDSEFAVYLDLSSYNEYVFSIIWIEN